MVKQQPQPSREAQMIAGLDAFQETVRERDEAREAVDRLTRQNSELTRALDESRNTLAILLRDRDALTRALATANAQMRTVHTCMRDMARATEEAVETAKEVDMTGAEAMAKRLAPQAKQPSAEEFRATLADRLVAGQNGNSQAVQK